MKRKPAMAENSAEPRTTWGLRADLLHSEKLTYNLDWPSALCVFPTTFWPLNNVGLNFVGPLKKSTYKWTHAI